MIPLKNSFYLVAQGPSQEQNKLKRFRKERSLAYAAQSH